MSSIGKKVLTQDGRVAHSPFTRRRIRRYLAISIITRFIAVAGVLVAIFVEEMKASTMSTILLLALAEAVANVAYFIVGFKRWPRAAFHFTGIVDAAAIAVLVAITGGIQSNFVVLFVFVIVFNGVFYGWPGLLSGAVPSVAALVVASAIAPGQAWSSKMGVELGVFAALGFLAGIVGEGERASRSELKEKAAENARQARQLKALYETSTTIGSHIEAEALLTTAVEHAHEFAKESWGPSVVTAISMIDAGRDEMVVTRVEGSEAHALPSTRFPMAAVDAEVRERLFAGKPFFIGSEGLQRLRVQLDLPRDATVTVAPIAIGSEVLGSLTVRSDRVDPPPKDQIDVLEGIANHVASAIGRVRTLDQERKRREEAVSLFEVARDLNAITDLNSVLARICEVGARLAGVDTCAVVLMKPEGGIDPELGSICSSDEPARATITDLAGLAIHEVAEALAEKRPVEIRDHVRASDGARRAAALLGVERCLILPILSHDEPLGMLCFGYRDPSRTFSIHQMQLGEAIAGLTAVATQNVRLHNERDRTVVELRELDRLKTEFVSTASHELRSPLTSITGFAHTLLRHGTKLSEEERTDFLTVINQQAKQLARLIDELLTVSRIEQGKLALSLQRVDATKLTMDAIVAAKMRSESHIFGTDFEPDFPPLVADEGKLNEIVTNLIDNAIKYSPKGGRIVIGGKVADHEVILWVSDEGAGIPEAELGNVFNKYYQVPGRPQAGGSGLGLYIVSELVKAHDGRIWVESNEGEGSTFFVAFPQRRATDRLVLADR